LIRDTALFRPFRPEGKEKKIPSLVALSEYWLKQSIRAEGTHDSVEDARIALRLYRLKSRMWERQLKSAMIHHTATVAAATEASAKAAEAEESSDEGEQVERSAAATKKPEEEYKNKGKKARAREKKRLAAETEAGVQANEAKQPQKGADKVAATKNAQGKVESAEVGKKRSAPEAAIADKSSSEKPAKRRKKMRPTS